MGVRAVVDRPIAVGGGFLRGLRYPLRGLRFVYLEHPSLVRFWIWPILFTVVAAGLVLYWVVGTHDAMLAAMWPEPAGEGFWNAVARGVHAFASFVFALLLGLLSLVVVVLSANLVAAPFNDALSEEVERIATGNEGPPFSFRRVFADLGRTLRVEVAKLGLYASIMLPAFVLSLVVPGVGQIVYSLFGFLFTAIYFAVDYVDWPASRRGVGVRARTAFVRARLPTMVGFGSGVWVFLFLPVLNLFFMPAAVAGGTLLYLDCSAGDATGGRGDESEGGVSVQVGDGDGRSG